MSIDAKAHPSPLDEIAFVKTIMAEECGTRSYTHGTTIYLSEGMLDQLATTGATNGQPDDSSVTFNIYGTPLFFSLRSKLVICMAIAQ